MPKLGETFLTWCLFTQLSTGLTKVARDHHNRKRWRNHQGVPGGGLGKIRRSHRASRRFYQEFHGGTLAKKTGWEKTQYFLCCSRKIRWGEARENWSCIRGLLQNWESNKNLCIFHVIFCKGTLAKMGGWANFSSFCWYGEVTRTDAALTKIC